MSKRPTVSSLSRLETTKDPVIVLHVELNVPLAAITSVPVPPCTVMGPNVRLPRFTLPVTLFVFTPPFFPVIVTSPEMADRF